MFVQECLTRHYKTWGAVSELRGIVVNEGFLDWMQFVAARQRFDGCDLGSLSLNRKDHAGINGSIVHEDGARAAFATITHTLCACELKVISQCIEQRNAGFQIGLALFPVDGEFHRELTRAVGRNFVVIRHYQFGAGHKGYSCRDTRDLQEISAGDALTAE